MFNGSTLSDPASVSQGAAGGFGPAVAATAYPQSPAQPQPSGKVAGNPWLPSWRKVNDTWGFYYEKGPGNWSPIPDEVRNRNPAEFGLPREALMREAARSKEQKEAAERAGATARSERADLLSLRRTEVAQSGQQIANAYQIARTNAGNDSRRIESQHTTTLAALEAQREATREQTRVALAGIMQQGSNLEKTLAANALQARDQNETNRFQIQKNDELMRDRMRMEGDQFDRQIAQDERASRRARIMGSLTLVAQSLARL